MKTSTTFAFLSLTLFCTSVAYADPFGSGLNSFDIEFVDIGSPGNAADTTGDPNPVGSVAQSYRIGKFEISRDMILKANAEGGLGIALPDMSLFGGNGVNRPATGTTWFEAAQFVNWLNTSTGNAPAYNFDGGGNFQLWQPGDAGYDPNNLFRSSVATYFLPSLDEWYKAAYYDPTSGVYFDFPTGSDTAPTAVTGGTAAGTAVFDQALLFTGPADITQAGGLSPFGTMGQGGNVWEFQETELDLINDSTSSTRSVRGGFWNSTSFFLSTSVQSGGDPTAGSNSVGFRVASVSVPEPSSLLLGVLGAVGLLLWRRVSR